MTTSAQMAEGTYLRLDSAGSGQTIVMLVTPAEVEGEQDSGVEIARTLAQPTEQESIRLMWLVSSAASFHGIEVRDDRQQFMDPAPVASLSERMEQVPSGDDAPE